MNTKVKVLADSITDHGVRLTTLECTFPRIILAEVNTHRMLSRNSASSRAIPVQRTVKQIQEHPFIPAYWGKNQKGMQAFDLLPEEDAQVAEKIWLEAVENALTASKKLGQLGVHKQITNRLLEPFAWQTAIISATEWDNFLNLRAHKDAQPEFQELARGIKYALKMNHPAFLKPGEWHLPLIGPEFGDEEDIETWDEETKILVSIGRCARVSYKTHLGVRDPIADKALALRLIRSGHLSPTEHVATPMEDLAFYGNFKGWKQYRKYIPFEHDILGKVIT